MLPVLKNFLYTTLIADGMRKGYQRSCILLTVTPLHSRVRSRRESNNGIHARWLGEVWVVHVVWKASLTRKVVCACRRRIANRSRVVSCESRIVHMFYYLCLYSLHLLHRTLHRRTHILPFFALQMSVIRNLSCPRLCIIMQPKVSNDHRRSKVR